MPTLRKGGPTRAEVVEKAPVVYGRYQLLELLARGGMAEVFKAKSHGVEGFEKILVIKRILEDLSQNPEFVEMFINEAKIAVTLSHANIVQVFDLGRADDTYFIAMEYVAGSDLATIFRRAKKYEKPLSTNLAVYIISEIAKGMDYAHRRRDSEMRPLNIVHRDVSPQNILVSYEGEVKLTDFGIAKARTSMVDGTDSGVLKGKYAYMSPEQARGLDVDARTDIFALGTVLFEALSGSSPFQTPSTYDTLQLVRSGFSPPIQELAPHVPDELAAVVDKAMSPDADDRYQNAGEFYEDLVQFLYSTGGRVSAQNLSVYVDAIRMASRGRRSSPDGDQILAAFEAKDDEQNPHDLTPAEVPSARPEGRITTGSGRRAAPRAERQDLTVVAVKRGELDAVAERGLKAAGARVESGESVIFGIFGLLQPDGRDAEVAARCALSLAHRGARTGVASGRLVVSSKRLRRDEASASLLAEAASLSTQAATGDVLVSVVAERAMRRHFELTERVDSLFELKAEKDIAANGPFVGRRNEMRVIGEILAMASKGVQRLLTIIGEAGSGKTRLLQETIRRLRVGGHEVGMTVTVMPGQGPHSAVEAMLRDLLGLSSFAQNDEIREKVARLRELGLSRAETDAVAAVLGISDSSEAEHDLLGAIRRIATKLAEDRLTVFAFDTFDNVDEESLALFKQLIGNAGGGRIVIVIAHRPDAPFDWSAYPNHAEIRLGPLTDDDVARLVAARLGASEVPMELLRDVGNKSAGNPLYVEEYLMALQDAGAITGTDPVEYRAGEMVEKVPRSLRGIVSGRLSRLTDDQRHLLRVAAVIGGRFHAVMIGHVAGVSVERAGEQLLQLVDRGLLAQPNVDEFRFAHNLIEQVILEALPLEVKRELHGSVAEAFESVYPRHLDELAERLATHHKEAGNRKRAIEYLVRSADRMEGEHALAGAASNLLRVVKMIAQAPNPDREQSLSLYRRIGELYFRSRALDEGMEAMDAALELAEGIGRDEYVARFSMMRGQFLAHANRFVESLPWFQRARSVGRRVGNTALVGEIARSEAETEARNGNYQTAVGLLQEALELAEDAADTTAQIRARLPLALAFAGTGNRDQAFDALDGVRELAAARADRFLECEIYKTESLICYFTGDLDRGLRAGQRGLELAKEYGFSYEAAVNAHNVGEMHMRQGDFKRAFALLRYSYDVAREHGYLKMQYNNMRVLGFIDATKLGNSEGRDRIVDALTYAEEQAFVWDIVQGRYMLAFVDHVQGRVKHARKAFVEICKLANEYGQKHYEGMAEAAIVSIDKGESLSFPH